jgi:hypothetical protein
VAVSESVPGCHSGWQRPPPGGGHCHCQVRVRLESAGPSRGYSLAGCAQAASKEQAPAHAAIGTLKLRCQPATCQWAASGSDSESVNALTAGSLPLHRHTPWTLTGNGDGGQGLGLLSGSRLSDIITMLAVFARSSARSGDLQEQSTRVAFGYSPLFGCFLLTSPPVLLEKGTVAC